MTREETKQAIAVMQHYADGGEVEVISESNSTWSIAVDPCWDWALCKYRIKPKPQLTIEVGRWYELKGGMVGKCISVSDSQVFLHTIGYVIAENILREVRVEAVE